MTRALIVVDVQNDFCPGGSLAVDDGDEVARRITRHLAEDPHRYTVVVATLDWHPEPGALDGFEHFAEEPDFVDTWPPHCVAETAGAELHPDLRLPPGTVVVRKGQTSAAYSGFEGRDELGTALTEMLRRRGVVEVDVVGLATDYCVLATAIDARNDGFGVRVLVSMVAGVAEPSSKQALADMEAAGVELSGGPVVGPTARR